MKPLALAFTLLHLALGWNARQQGEYPTAIAADRENSVWVGTEGGGVLRYDPGAKTWTQYTKKDGLGDDCVYALAVDNEDRVWAGHLNHGVSVFNGKKWQNYGLLDGPLGDRVFAIAVSPRDGDVWMATDMGLARYRQKQKDWDYYTRASGLPSDQIAGVVFDPKGVIYAATQCDGVVTAAPEGDYAKWSPIPEAAIFGAPAGKTMPVELCNGVACARPQASGDFVESLIVVPTPLGLADHACYRQNIIVNGGGTVIFGGNPMTSWTFQPTLGAQAQAPPGTALVSGGCLNDWVLGVQPEGRNIWISYRKSGVELKAVGVPEPTLLARTEHPDSVLIRAVLAQDDLPPLFAVYGPGGGLMTLPDAPPLVANGKRKDTAPDLPRPPSAPLADDSKPLASLLDKVSSGTKPLAPGEAVYIADDWRTQGDWVGRYGNSYARLYGMSKALDEVFPLQPGYETHCTLGPDRKPGRDSTISQSPITGPMADNDSRFLYDPAAGVFQDAFVGDGSEDAKIYPDDFDGPGLQITVKIPDGVHCLSLYFVNTYAHVGGSDIYHDYDVSIVPFSADPKKSADVPPLAHTRVTDFWGGVYKQFMIAGPAQYAVRIGRNGSSGTRLQGLFLDRVSGDQPENPGTLPGFANAPYELPDVPDNYKPSPLTQSAVSLWSLMDNALTLRGAVALQMPFRIWCYRAAIAGKAPENLLEHWRWQISLWTAEDRLLFENAMRKAHDAAKAPTPAK